MRAEKIFWVLWMEFVDGMFQEFKQCWNETTKCWLGMRTTWQWCWASKQERPEWMRTTKRTTAATWMSCRRTKVIQRRNKRENEEHLDSLGMKCEGDGRDFCTSGRNQKRNDRQVVLCDVISWKTMTKEGGCQCLRWNEEEEEADRH